MNTQQTAVTDFGRGGAEICDSQNGHTVLKNQRLFPQFGHFIVTCVRWVLANRIINEHRK
jgi:hypothetical protein